MSIRTDIACVLRAVNVSPVLARVDRAVFDLEVWCQNLAERLDPTVLDWDAEQWPTLGYITDEGFTTDPWEEAVGRYNALGPYFDDFVSRMTVEGFAGLEWKDPTLPSEALREETLAKVAEAMKRPATIQFERVDLSPFTEVIDKHVRELAEQYRDAAEAPMVDWLNDVGTVVPGFDADAAREIVRRRDDILDHPLAGGEIGRAGE